jgi:hypothetical protein
MLFPKKGPKKPLTVYESAVILIALSGQEKGFKEKLRYG